MPIVFAINSNNDKDLEKIWRYINDRHGRGGSCKANATLMSRPDINPRALDAPQDGLRINEDIIAPKVRLIGAEGENKGILSLRDAQAAALADNLDLVEVAPESTPPVCRLLDYGKFKYQAQKRASEARRKQKIIEVKEIKMRPTIDDHDYAIKLRKSEHFLKSGDKVKVSLRFRGREMTRPEIGERLMGRLKEALTELARVEAEPKMEGRQMVMIFAPKPAKSGGGSTKPSS